MNVLRAWRLLQAWGYGQVNINQVINAMEMVFGERFVHKEWDGILNAIHAVLDQEEEEIMEGEAQCTGTRGKEGKL